MKTEQINVRLPPQLLADAKRHAIQQGYRNIQSLIEAELRDLVYDDNIELTASGKAKLKRALREMYEGKTISGDQILQRLEEKSRKTSEPNRKISGKRA